MHREYGGVFPTVAKREHGINLPVLLLQILKESGLHTEAPNTYSEETWSEMERIFLKNPGVYESFKGLTETLHKPDIDVIAVTSGPGLAPALWVGITFAEALGKLWGIPVVPVNHMEGHIVSVLMESGDSRPVEFPALALLISGGHTELVDIKGWGQYEVIGSTRDDAVGEAYDKAARMMGLPYPGGIEISKLSAYAYEHDIPRKAKLPRPMIHSHDLNFSFSGIKTAVLYYIRDHFEGDHTKMTEDEKADLAREFDDAVNDVLMAKSKAALESTSAKTFIVAGGVSADKRLQKSFLSLEESYPELRVKLPIRRLATDNALMIAGAAYVNIELNPELLKSSKPIVAEGNLKLSTLSLR